MFVRTAQLPSRISVGWREDFFIFYVSVAPKKKKKKPAWVRKGGVMSCLNFDKKLFPAFLLPRQFVVHFRIFCMRKI